MGNALSKGRTYHDEENALDGRADEHEHTGAEDDGHCYLLQGLQAGFPKHWNWHEDEVWVGREIRSECHPDDGHRDGRLADV